MKGAKLKLREPTGDLPLKKLGIFFIIILSCCHVTLSFAPDRPPFPPALHQIFKNLKQKPSALINDDDWTDEDKSLNVFNSKALIQNLIPTFLKGTFKSSEDFEAFASTTLSLGVDDECLSHLLELFFQLLAPLLQNGNLPATWALQMVDAWGKFPSGMLSGHTQIPGDFHECLQIRGFINKTSGETSSFKGKYCSTFLVPVTDSSQNVSVEAMYNSEDYSIRNRASRLRESVSLTNGKSFVANGIFVPVFSFIGTCFPSSCSVEDTQAIFNDFYNSSFTMSGALTQAVLDCYTDEKPSFDAGDITVITLLTIIAFLCLVGSLFDIIVVHRLKFDPKDLSLLSKILLAFSIPSNTEKLLSTKAGSGNLGCLHGLRFLSLTWVLLCHTWAMNGYQFTWNLIDLQNIYKSHTLQAIVNGTVSVDTFFTISGTLMSYNLLRELDRNKGKFNYPLMVLHRYLRLTPVYAIVVAIMATILPYFASGPQWYIMDVGSEICAKNWWYNILYINNFQPEENVCYTESWYLSNDMQFFLFSPVIIYPLWRWKRIGFALLGAFSIAGIVTAAVVQHVKKLSPTSIPFFDGKTYVNDLYIAPWTRMGPYLVGIFVGYVLYYKSKSPTTFRNIPVAGIVLGWCLSTVTALLVVFGVQNMFDPANVDLTQTSMASAFYAGLHRFAWGGVIAWIIFACVSGYGGWVNRFLSWKIFMPLGRLTFCIYISSYHLQQLYHLTQTHPMHYSVYSTVNYFFAHLVMSCLVGYILTITLEAPFIQLENVLLPSKRSQPKTKADLPHTLNNNNN